jgi:hypothetical protein
MKPIVGVWDQWCVASDKPYIKMATLDDGTEIEQTSLLDAESCRQIVRNFGLSKDDLPCTLGHQHTTVDKAQYKTATYSALAYWRGGKVDTFAAHGDIQRPTETDLPHADNGQRPEDGIYAFRQTVTDLGEAIVTKRAVRKTSPEFVMDGRNQQNKSIGPQALGLAWTDDPFLNGCEINLERFPQMRKFANDKVNKMAHVYLDPHNERTVDTVQQIKEVQQEMRERGISSLPVYVGEGQDEYRNGQQVHAMSKHKFESEAGVEEKDSPEIKFGKLKAHFGRKAMMEAGIQDADSPDVALGKFAKHMECHEADGEAARKMEGAKRRMEAEGEGEGSCHEGEAEAGRKHGMEGPTVHAGAPTMVDPGKPSEKVVGGHSMETTQALAYEVKRMRAEMEKQAKTLQAYEAKDKRQTAQAKVSAAWQQGRIVPLPGESSAQAQQRFLVKFERDPKLFEADLAPTGTHTIPGNLDMQLTRSGLPVAFERDGSAMDFGGRNPDEEIIARAQALQAKNPKLSNHKAAQQVLMESPQLGPSYVTQSRRAALGLG